MNRRLGFVSAGVLFALVLAAPTHAQMGGQNTDRFEVFGGYLRTSSVKGPQGGSITSFPGQNFIMFGLRAGSSYTDRWAVEFGFAYASTTQLEVTVGLTTTQTDARFLIADLSILHHFNPDSRFIVVLFAGPSWVQSRIELSGTQQKDDHPALHGGAALKTFILPWETAYLRFDARFRYFSRAMEFDDHRRDITGVEATFGLGVEF
jgi:hypothetical protein